MPAPRSACRRDTEDVSPTNVFSFSPHPHLSPPPAASCPQLPLSSYLILTGLCQPLSVVCVAAAAIVSPSARQSSTCAIPLAPAVHVIIAYSLPQQRSQPRSMRVHSTPHQLINIHLLDASMHTHSTTSPMPAQALNTASMHATSPAPSMPHRCTQPVSTLQCRQPRSRCPPTQCTRRLHGLPVRTCAQYPYLTTLTLVLRPPRDLIPYIIRRIATLINLASCSFLSISKIQEIKSGMLLW